MKTTKQIDGYTVTIATDPFPENPFTPFDCEPPLLALPLSNSKATAYNGAPEDWYDVLRLLPDNVLQRGNRVAFIRRFLPEGYTLREIAADIRRVGIVETIAEELGREYGETPEGWRSAREWMETAAAILEYAGIPCLVTESTGYCQGDATLLLAVATPAWVNLVGAPADSLRDYGTATAGDYGTATAGDYGTATAGDGGTATAGDYGTATAGDYGIAEFQRRHNINNTATLPELVKSGNPLAVSLALKLARQARKQAA